MLTCLDLLTIAEVAAIVVVVDTPQVHRHALSTSTQHSNEMVLEDHLRRYKFLNEGWETYEKEDGDSLSSFLKKKITAINISDDLYEEQWDRIYVPTICSKFKSLRCNLNNAIRGQYKGELRVSKC